MVVKIRDFFIFFILIFLVLLSSCSSTVDSNSNHGVKQYPVLTPPFRIGINQLSEKDSVPDLLIDLKEKFTSNDQIQNPIMPFEITNKWSISYRINTAKNFDLFVVNQKTNLNSKIIVLISTEKDQVSKIISAVIVGIDNYSEISENIEFEEWNTIINPDLSLKVHKQYQLISALEEKNVDLLEKVNIQKSKTEIEETYQIKDNGIIDFVKKDIFSKPSVPAEKLSYRAVIAFKTTSEEDDPINDEWLLNNVEIQNICSYQNIHFVQSYDNFNQIMIINESGYTMDTLDISFIASKIAKGYVMVQSNNDPSFIEFGKKDEILKAISNYFNIELLLDE